MRPGGVDLVRLLALLERIGVEAEGVSAAPKEPAPTEVLDRCAAWDPVRATAEIEAAWAALDEAIADRDLKPANVMRESLAAASSDRDREGIDAAEAGSGDPWPHRSEPAGASLGAPSSARDHDAFKQDEPRADAARAQRSEPPSWRDHVAWPAPADEQLRATPVGRWTLLAGRWALLARSRPDAPPVLVRVLGDTDARPIAERELDSRPRYRVEVWCGGVCQGWHEVPNRVVEIYVTDDLAAMMRGNCPARPDGSSASAAPEVAPTAPATAPRQVTTSGQVGFGW